MCGRIALVVSWMEEAGLVKAGSCKFDYWYHAIPCARRNILTISNSSSFSAIQGDNIYVDTICRYLERFACASLSHLPAIRSKGGSGSHRVSALLSVPPARASRIRFNRG